MTGTRRCAARLRGVFVGASSGAVVVAAHGAGGADDLPASPGIVLLVLLCAATGALAASPKDNHRRLPVVLAHVAAAQLFGHCALVFVSAHAHGDHWSAPMLAAHAGAAITCAALICTVERLFGAAAGVLWRLVLVLVAPRDGDHPRRPRRAWWLAGLASRILTSSGLGTRGPPSLATAA